MKIYWCKCAIIAVFCFVTALCLGSQAMDDSFSVAEKGSQPSKTLYESKIQESSLGNTAVFPSRLIEQQESGIVPTLHTWVSYIISPVKTTIKVANKFCSIAMQNPKLVTLSIMTYVLPVVVDAACMCYCTKYCTPISGWHERGDHFCDAARPYANIYVGDADNLKMCLDVCKELRYGFSQCMPK